MVDTLAISAADFVGDQPHFITWTVEGSGRTWCACHPQDRLPFVLSQIVGLVDRSNVFRAAEIESIYVDGLKVLAVVIERDRELSVDQSKVDTVRMTARQGVRQQS